MGQDVLITGLPRGGTTLTMELLGGLPDCVAVDEPMNLDLFLEGALGGGKRRFFASRRPAAGPDRNRIAENVVDFCRRSRATILSDGTVLSKHVEGGVYGAKVADVLTPDGKRVRLARRGLIQVNKELTEDFTFFVKHNSAFVGILSELAARAQVYGVVRNPLAVLASWNTVPFAVGRGHATLAERFDPELERALAGMPEVLDRQIYLLDWFFRRIAQVLPTGDVVRYEDIVSSQGTALARIHPAAASIQAKLSSRNRASVYDPDLMRILGDRLVTSEGSYWSFYDRRDVIELIPA